MRVARNNRIEARALRFKVKIAKIVQHIETEAGHFDNGSEWKFQRPRLRVHITANGKDWRDQFELRKDFRSPHVSRVNDYVHTLKSPLGFRAQKTVSIGNDADPHGGRKNA